MSGYPQRPSWRAREQARKAAADDAERRKTTEVTETNFPTLITAQPVKQAVTVFDQGFASLAQQWAKDEENDRRLDAYRKSQAESERRQYESLYRIRAPRNESRRDWSDEDEDTPAPAPAPVAAGAGDDEESGWIEVKRKVRKPKRELSIAEMEARDRQREAEEEHVEFNAELYESGRHDHDRV